MKKFVQFVLVLLKTAFSGSKLYLGWISLLALLVLAGIGGYAYDILGDDVAGNMTDQVSWGAFIANFTFTVGLPAAAVMVVIPAYFYKNEAMRQVVWVGEFMAIVGVIMCLTFIMADIGHPERAWHLIPGIGRMNLPKSLLSWDVVVLNGYLVINVFLLTYAMFRMYHGKDPRTKIYIAIVFLSVFWAVSIHTVTAFIYSGLGARPFWNSALIAPRFLVSAFVAGPAFMLVALQVIEKNTAYQVPPKAIDYLRRLLAVTMTINIFFFVCEIFTEMYTGSLHSASAAYLLEGYRGRHLLVPYIWSATALNVFAVFVFAIPRFFKHRTLLNVACVAAFIGIWVEKGMGLLVPGFIPSPLGEMSEYQPSLDEGIIGVGIWALGILAFTLSIRVAVEIERGALRAPGVPLGPVGHGPAHDAATPSAPPATEPTAPEVA